MRSFRLAIGTLSIVFCGGLAAPLIPIEQAAPATKPSPLVLASNEGERREFRTRPGVTFTLKIDPQNGGSQHMAVEAENKAPGDKISTPPQPPHDGVIFFLGGAWRGNRCAHIEKHHARTN